MWEIGFVWVSRYLKWLEPKIGPVLLENGGHCFREDHLACGMVQVEFMERVTDRDGPGASSVHPGRSTVDLKLSEPGIFNSELSSVGIFSNMRHLNPRKLLNVLHNTKAKGADPRVCPTPEPSRNP